jgi:hypothetical protein
MGRWRAGARWWLVAVSPVAFLAIALAGMLAAGKELPAPPTLGGSAAPRRSAWSVCSC